MSTRCASVGMHEHYLLNHYVSTTQLVKSSTDASKVYSSTACAAADLSLVLFVSSRICVQIQFGLVHGFDFEFEEAAE